MTKARYVVSDHDTDNDVGNIVYTYDEAQEILLDRNFIISTLYRFFKHTYEVVARFIYIIAAIVFIIYLGLVIFTKVDEKPLIFMALGDGILILVSFYLRFYILKILCIIRLRTVEKMLPHIEGFNEMQEWEQDKTRDALANLVGLRKVK